MGLSWHTLTKQWLIFSCAPCSIFLANVKLIGKIFSAHYLDAALSGHLCKASGTEEATLKQV